MMMTINISHGEATKTVEQYEAIAMDQIRAGRCRITTRVAESGVSIHPAAPVGVVIGAPHGSGFGGTLNKMRGESSELEAKINQAISDIGKPGWLGAISWWKGIDWKRTSRRERICGNALMYQSFYRAEMERSGDADEARRAGLGASIAFRDRLNRAGHPGDGLQ